ncbi:MAG: hypothetical protein GXZ07_09080 [Firmicutes bacterium]|nr:hypothetical protein [Bacillota bacterium]
MNKELSYLYNDDIKAALNALSEFIEGLIIPSKFEPSTIQALTHVHLVLQRMPYSTTGVFGHISIHLRINEELKYYDINVSEEEIVLFNGGSVYTQGVGSDSNSNKCFYMQTGGFIEGSDLDIYDWINGASELLNMGASISADSFDDTDEIGWDEKPE